MNRVPFAFRTPAVQALKASAHLALASACQKSPGLLRVQPLTLIFRLRRFIRRNGSPVSGGFPVRFAAREPNGREAKRGCPVKKLVF
jgi:hypothetical protein